MGSQLPNVTVGMEALRRDNPWPELPLSVEPFYLSLDSLDGGGRHLITDLIREQRINLMLEIGCFLCGSTRQWLAASPDLVVIGVDPWDGNWSRYIREMAAEKDHMLDELSDPMALADTVQRYGNYSLALNNVRDHRDRFIPVRRRSPEALRYLKARAIRPELVYIDAFKSDEDLWVAHELFPKAVLCGDDWTWQDEAGRYRMREHVEHFVDEKGFEVHAEGATWIVSTPPGPADWDGGGADALLREIDRESREVLLYIASASASGAGVTLGAAARDLKRSPTELLQAAKLINEAAASLHRIQVLGLAETGTPGWDALGKRPFVVPHSLVTLLTTTRR